MFGPTGAGDERIWGYDGCDLIASGKGNDTVYGGKEMDALYGGRGNDKLKGHKGHDHLFGGSGAGISSGNDLLDTRDGENERGEIEEVHGGDGLDRCFLDPDPDGVKFSGCEYLWVCARSVPAVQLYRPAGQTCSRTLGSSEL